MATTFDVIYLGTFADLDPTEGNTTTEDAALLVGTTFGGAGAPLSDNIRTLVPVGTPGASYGTDNTTPEQYAIDGTTYTHDGFADYTALVTFADGTTAEVPVNIIQTTTGEVFLAPNTTGEEDIQALMDSQPITSLEILSMDGNASEFSADRLPPNYIDSTVDGTTGDDDMRLGYADADGTTITGGDDTINGGDGNDFIEGAGGSDSISGGSGNDTIYGDMVDGSVQGTLDLNVTDNLSDGPVAETFNIRAVQLVTLANGDLIMITSEREGPTDGISSYRIDNDPNSATYGQIIGGQIDTLTEGANGAGYNQVYDMASTTLEDGSTYIFTADLDSDTIGVARVNLDGSLTEWSEVTSGTDLDKVQKLTVAEADGQQFLLAYANGTSEAINVFSINSDGTLTQTDIEVDADGAGENYLDGDVWDTSLLESFTDSSGNTYVVAAGTTSGISLWTLDGTGQLTFENARGDDQAGAGEFDPQGNDLGRDVISPANTGLFLPEAGTFAEIDGQVYLFVGGQDDDVVVFRIDPDAANGDGSFDLTLVGHVDDIVANISTMTILETDDGLVLVIGGEQNTIEFHAISVDGTTGEVTLVQVGSLTDETNGATELDDSESIAVEGGVLVSASDNDSGVTIFSTGLNPQPQTAGDDIIDGGDGNDLIFAGDGNDTIDGGAGNDTISGGAGDDSLEGGDGRDRVVFDGNYADYTYDIIGPGQITVTNIATGEVDTVSGFEEIQFADGLFDLVIGTDADDSLIHDGPGFGQDADFIIGGDGNDYFESGDDDDVLLGGAGSDTFFSGPGADTILGGDGNDNITQSDKDSIDGGDGIDTLDSTFGTFDDIYTFTTATGGVYNAATSNGGTFENIEVFLSDGGAETYDASLATSDLTFSTGAGNDTIIGGAGNDTILGGTGDDTISGGAGSDVLDGGDGRDRVVFDGNHDDYTYAITGPGQITVTEIATGDVDTVSAFEEIQFADGLFDLVVGTNNADVLIHDGSGVGQDADFIIGGDGDDYLEAGSGDDVLIGGAGNDTLEGGAGEDTLTGGDGADVFVAGGDADVITDFDTITGIDGGTNADNDFIDLTTFYNQTTLDAWNAANPGQTYETPLEWLRADQADDGILDQAGGLSIQNGGTAVASNELNAENTGVICFAAGTMIATPIGEVAIEQLRAGDRVLTRDNGPQRIVWIGHRHISASDLSANPKLRPIQVGPQVSGGHSPLILSPQHGLLLGLDGEETLVRATHLARLRGGHARVMQGCRGVTYFHLMFEAHQIIFANGACAESFFPGPNAFGALSTEARKEINTLFPHLNPGNAHASYSALARDIAAWKQLPSHLSGLSPRH